MNPPIGTSLGTRINEDRRALRDLMPALQSKTYFNYGGQGPLPSPSLEAIKASWDKIQELGPFTNKVWPYITEEVESTKKYLARICGVSTNRIALTENVTSGCVLPLWGLPLRKADRILISDCEHPGIVAACRELARRKQLEIDVLNVQQLRDGAEKQLSTNELLLEQLESSLKPHTKLVVLSHILWNTGQIMPIKDISKRLSQHPRDPFLLVDAAQSFGQLPIEEAANSSDIYAFTGHKWACGPEGLGGVSVSTRVLEESNPTLIGWRALQKEGSIYHYDPNPFYQDARRYEIATSCVPLLAGLRCSIDLLEKEVPIQARLNKIKQLSLKLWEHLNEIQNIQTIIQGSPPSGLISFSLLDKTPAKSLVKALGKEELWIRVLEDPTWLRACIHITSKEEEISTLGNAIRRIIHKDS